MISNGRGWFAHILITSTASLLMFVSPANAASRIKDLVSVEGIRDNILVGYGLVVGLSGTGDDLKRISATKESLTGMLERLGVNTKDGKMQPDNVAAVIVTATIPAFARQGARIDVQISSIGDASSLQGGSLAVTPLTGADGEVYAVAQGAVQVGGFAVQGQGASIQRGVPTAGRIPNGGIVEREPINAHLIDMRQTKMALRNPDLSTARRIAQAVNAFAGTSAAETLDPGTVLMRLPEGYAGTMVDFLTDIEQLQVEPDQAARIIIDENTGVIVIGQDVRISTVAVAQGNLTIKVSEVAQVSQPSPFSETGETVVVPRTDITVEEDPNRKLTVVPDGVSVQELVNGLNALGVGPRDMISILQAIKAAGALQAEIEVM